MGFSQPAVAVVAVVVVAVDYRAGDGGTSGMETQSLAGGSSAVFAGYGNKSELNATDIFLVGKEDKRDELPGCGVPRFRCRADVRRPTDSTDFF